MGQSQNRVIWKAIHIEKNYKNIQISMTQFRSAFNLDAIIGHEALGVDFGSENDSLLPKRIQATTTSHCSDMCTNQVPK